MLLETNDFLQFYLEFFLKDIQKCPPGSFRIMSKWPIFLMHFENFSLAPLSKVSGIGLFMQYYVI